MLGFDQTTQPTQAMQVWGQSPEPMDQCQALIMNHQPFAAMQTWGQSPEPIAQWEPILHGNQNTLGVNMNYTSETGDIRQYVPNGVSSPPMASFMNGSSGMPHGMHENGQHSGNSDPMSYSRFGEYGSYGVDA